MRKNFINSFVAFAQLAVLAIVMAVFHGGATVGATGSIAITGTVTNPSGSAVSNVSVTADSPGTTSVLYGPTSTASNGTYTLYVDAGTYDIHFDPPTGSGLDPRVNSNVTVLNNQTINAQLPWLTYAYSGTVTDQNNNPIVNLGIGLTNGPSGASVSTLTDSNGHYSMRATHGNYIAVIGANGTTVSNNMVIGQNSSGPGVDLMAGDVTQNMVLTTATLHVTLKDGAGNPVSNTSIYGSGSGTVTPYTNANFSVYVATPGGIKTDVNGNADVTTLNGMVYDAGDGSVSGSELCAGTTPGTCLSAALNVSGDTNVTLQEPVTHTLSGTLTGSDGSPLPNVEVDLMLNGSSYASSHTDTNGYYSVAGLPGSYTLRIYFDNASSQIPQLPNSIFDLRQSGGSSIDLTAGNVSQNLQLSSTSVTITVKDNSGNPVSNAFVSSNPYSGATSVSSNIQMTALAGASGRTNSSGVVVLHTLTGAQYGLSQGVSSSTDNLCAVVNSSNVCLYSPLTVNSDMAVVLQKDTVAPTLSYTVSPLPNSYGWNNTAVVVTFSCSDSWSGIASCTSPFTLYSEGTNQAVLGTATDKAGNTSTVTASISIDMTGPTVSNLVLSPNSFKSGATVTITANSSDALSGVLGAEYYIDTDPGVGLGTAMTLTNGKWSASQAVTLSRGTHTVFVRSKDKVGNWGTTVSATFTVK